MGDRTRRPRSGRAPFLTELNWAWNSTGCHLAGPGHLPTRGEGRADRKGGPAGPKERPGTREDRGAGREGVSGAGRALRNPGTGERARPLRERGRRALPTAVGKATRRSATLTRERGLYLAKPEVKTGFKQENVARGGGYADRGPKPPEKLLKPKRKDNWAAMAAAAFIRGRAPGARVFRSLTIVTP